ncbi:MAG: hypothetical protein F6J97_10500 [Leptolyngbya sp. SIO4C1]|nr:hypothetical protein [Leptolyngbya sp. SIO4C1]
MTTQVATSANQASFCILQQASFCILIDTHQSQNRPTVSLQLEDLTQVVAAA